MRHSRHRGHAAQGQDVEGSRRRAVTDEPDERRIVGPDEPRGGPTRADAPSEGVRHPRRARRRPRPTGRHDAVRRRRPLQRFGDRPGAPEAATSRPAHASTISSERGASCRVRRRSLRRRSPSRRRARAGTTRAPEPNPDWGRVGRTWADAPAVHRSRTRPASLFEDSRRPTTTSTRATTTPSCCRTGPSRPPARCRRWSWRGRPEPTCVAGSDQPRWRDDGERATRSRASTTSWTTRPALGRARRRRGRGRLLPASRATTIASSDELDRRAARGVRTGRRATPTPPARRWSATAAASATATTRRRRAAATATSCVAIACRHRPACASGSALLQARAAAATMLLASGGRDPRRLRVLHRRARASATTPPRCSASWRSAALVVAASLAGLAAYPIVFGLTVMVGLLWYLWVAPGEGSGAEPRASPCSGCSGSVCSARSPRSSSASARCVEEPHRGRRPTSASGC